MGKRQSLEIKCKKYAEGFIKMMEPLFLDIIRREQKQIRKICEDEGLELYRYIIDVSIRFWVKEIKTLEGMKNAIIKGNLFDEDLINFSNSEEFLSRLALESKANEQDVIYVRLLKSRKSAYVECLKLKETIKMLEEKIKMLEKDKG